MRARCMRVPPIHGNTQIRNWKTNVVVSENIIYYYYYVDNIYRVIRNIILITTNVSLIFII